VVGVLAIALYKVLATLVTSAHAAIIITALVLAFVSGALAAIFAICFGVRLRNQASASGGVPREQPARKLYVYRKPTTRLGSYTFGTVNGPTAITQPHTIQVAAPEEAPIPFVHNGIAHVLDTPARRKNAAIVEWAEPDLKTDRIVIRSIDVQTLRRFARLHTPARSEWSGKNATYSACLAFFRFAGWLVPATTAGKGKGVVWHMHYQNLQRRLRYLGDLAECDSTSAISQAASPPPAPYPDNAL
jgi:hypothetical protein